MKSSLAPALAAVLLLAVAPASLVAEESFLSVTVSEPVVEISGVTPGGTVALLGADRQRLAADEGPSLVKIVESLSDDDGDGAVAYERAPVDSQASVWVAVDTESGRAGSATSFGEPVSPFDSPLGLAKPLENGPAAVAAEGHDELLLLLVRPGKGAWSALAVDGGLGEETGVANGRVTFYEPDWTALRGEEAGPGDRVASDVLLALDPKTFAADARLARNLTWLPSQSTARGE